MIEVELWEDLVDTDDSQEDDIQTAWVLVNIFQPLEEVNPLQTPAENWAALNEQAAAHCYPRAVKIGSVDVTIFTAPNPWSLLGLSKCGRFARSGR